MTGLLKSLSSLQLNDSKSSLNDGMQCPDDSISRPRTWRSMVSVSIVSSAITYNVMERRDLVYNIPRDAGQG